MVACYARLAPADPSCVRLLRRAERAAADPVGAASRELCASAGQVPGAVRGEISGEFREILVKFHKIRRENR